jgi:hypothetical protein
MEVPTKQECRSHARGSAEGISEPSLSFAANPTLLQTAKSLLKQTRSLAVLLPAWWLQPGVSWTASAQGPGSLATSLLRWHLSWAVTW